MRIPSWAATAARALYREQASRVYLSVVGAAFVLMLLDTVLLSHRSLSLTGVLLMLLTLPWTPLLWALFVAVGGMNAQATAFGWAGWSLTVVAALVSAGLNAALIGHLVRRAGRRRVEAR
jgi:hypothetical protein